MGLIAWIVLGVVAGFIASKLVNKQGEGFIVDLILGVVGSVVGGFLFNAFGIPATAGFDFYSLIVAVIGAVVVLWIYHAVVGRRSTL